MTTDTREQTFEIPRTRLDYLTAQMADLAKRADKLGLDGLTIGYEVLREYTLVVRRERDLDGTVIEVKRAFVEVRVYGEAPVLAGWSLLGRLDYQAIPGAVLRAMVPGEACPAELADVPSTRCDACHVARRRNDVFLLRHEDGREIVVGRNCLRDYLGHVSPEQIASMAAMLATLVRMSDPDDEFWGGGRGIDAWDVREVLTLAAFSIRQTGWAPSKSERSTRDDVTSLLYPSRGLAEETRQAQLKLVSTSDVKHAENAIGWLETLTPAGDYLYNLQAIATTGVVTPKTIGLAVSAIVAYDRAMEQETKRRARAASEAGSTHVGAVKERRVFAATVTMIRRWETAYGLTTLIKMLDDTGNVLIWKASNSPDVSRGDRLSFKGTIKAHDEYQGVAQTLLTRCANLEVLAAGPDRDVTEEAT